MVSNFSRSSIFTNQVYVVYQMYSWAWYYLSRPENITVRPIALLELVVKKFQCHIFNTSLERRCSKWSKYYWQKIMSSKREDTSAVTSFIGLLVLFGQYIFCFAMEGETWALIMKSIRAVSSSYQFNGTMYEFVQYIQCLPTPNAVWKELVKMCSKRSVKAEKKYCAAAKK